MDSKGRMDGAETSYTFWQDGVGVRVLVFQFGDQTGFAVRKFWPDEALGESQVMLSRNQARFVIAALTEALQEPSSASVSLAD